MTLSYPSVIKNRRKANEIRYLHGKYEEGC